MDSCYVTHVVGAGVFANRCNQEKTRLFRIALRLEE
jgi:hypothetical protein